MTKIPSRTLERIYMLYYGAPCKFKDTDGKWKKSRFGVKTFDAMYRRECILLLNPLTSLKQTDIAMIGKLTNDEHAENELTENKVQEFIDDMIEHGYDFAVFPVIDYLRRGFFVTPVYGLDLIECGFAEIIDESKWKPDIEIRKLKQETAERKENQVPEKLNFEDSLTVRNY
jgi:hypothetical protein